MNNAVKKPNMNQNERYTEGPVAKAIETRTAKLPSDVFLWAALGAMATSLTFEVLGKRETGIFVGQWAPAFLLFGLYNKLVKVAGSDQSEANQNPIGRGASLASQSR